MSDHPSDCSHLHHPETANSCLNYRPGSLLHNRYRILKLLGEGGLSRTFLAVDETVESAGLQPNQWLATNSSSSALRVVKQLFLPNSSFEYQERAIDLFHREALRLAELGDHPQIPMVLDSFEQEGQHYLVQEWVDGRNLEQELTEEGAFSESQICQLLSDILSVLQFIHDHQIVHRDIKPTNIIRRHQTGLLTLVDFDAAKSIDNVTWDKTEALVGSAEYTAPEQMSGKAIFASDLYSLGVTCIHLLTQMSPFDLFDSHENDWIWRDYLPAPISHSLGQVLDRLLQPAIQHRYTSAMSVLQDLNLPEQQIDELLLRNLLDATVSECIRQADCDKTIKEATNFSWAVAAFLRVRLPSTATSVQDVRPTSVKPSPKQDKIPWFFLVSVWFVTVVLASGIVCLINKAPQQTPKSILETKQTMEFKSEDE